jgi:hypothetical protein
VSFIALPRPFTAPTIFVSQVGDPRLASVAAAFNIAGPD